MICRLLFPVILLNLFVVSPLFADELVTPAGTLENTSISYTIVGDVATQPAGLGQDLRLTTNSGGSFTVSFSDPVDLTLFNSENDSGTVNFDGNINGTNIRLTSDSGNWSYVGGDLDLTNGNNGGENIVNGLGTNEATIGNARTVFQDNNGDNVADSGAPRSDADWGTFSISGITELTFTFTDQTNFEAFRINAVRSFYDKGDVDRNGVVNFSDIPEFITVLQNGVFQAEADVNDDGVVNFLDISPFITRLAQGPPPEIVRFFHNAGTVAPGTPVLLEWETSNASALTLSEGIGDVSGQSSILIDAPQETTTYTLTATSGSQTIQEDLRLIVGGPRPNIVLCLVDDWGVMDTSVPFSYDNYQDGAQPVSYTHLTLPTTPYV